MIGRLTGIVSEIRSKGILIETSGGVGYEVFPAGSLLSKCKKGEKISADIFTVVRENEISLYGFGGAEEKQLFQKLIAISGIGPKTAIGIVSTPVGEFLSAVEKGEVSFLTRIPGLGKKTAERLIIELRGKLDLTAEMDLKPESPAMSEAVQALENLGYDRHTIGKRLQEANKKGSAEDLVKFFLKSNA